MNWLGIVVSGDSISLVQCTVEDGAITPILEAKWTLQAGSKPEAYAAMFERLKTHVQERAVELVLIKASALSRGGMKHAHLESAELRGVVQAAASAGGAKVRTPKKAVLSRVFGERKVDEYIADDGFWRNALKGTVKKGSREAAFMIVAEVSAT